MVVELLCQNLQLMLYKYDYPLTGYMYRVKTRPLLGTFDTTPVDKIVNIVYFRNQTGFLVRSIFRSCSEVGEKGTSVVPYMYMAVFRYANLTQRRVALWMTSLP